MNVIENLHSYINAKNQWRSYPDQKYRDEVARNIRLAMQGKPLRESAKYKAYDPELYKGTEQYYKTKLKLHGWYWTNEMAKNLVETEEWLQTLYHNLDKFRWLDEEIAGVLIKSLNTTSPYTFFLNHIIKNLDSFAWLSKEVLNEFATYIHRYSWTSEGIALRVNVVKNREKFEWADINEFTKLCDPEGRWTDEYIKYILTWYDEETREKCKLVLQRNI